MKVKAISKGFHVTLREPGDEFDIEGPVPGWCEKVGGTNEEPSKPAANTTPPIPATKGFVAKHAGGGHYRIEDAQGERVGDFSGTKEETEAEAARMNAGDPDLDDQDNGLPDA